MSAPRVLDARTLPLPLPLKVRIARHLRGGNLLAYPTETVYGLGCLVRSRPLARLLAMKRRDPGRPFLLLVPGRESVAGLRWTEPACRLAEAFWPGPLTLVLADPRGILPPGVRSDAGTVAVRVSPHPVARAVVEGVGEPITSTSANAPGDPPATCAGEALAAGIRLGAGEELWVLDGGRLAPSPPSTIVDCSGARPVVRREGAVPSTALREVIPDLP